ncbi:MAG: hypothetical protein ABI990_06640, partial [Actinomycetota bacterium]
VGRAVTRRNLRWRGPAGRRLDDRVGGAPGDAERQQRHGERGRSQLHGRSPHRLATALQDILERQGASTRLLSALEVREVAEPYIRRRAIRHLEKDRIVIFAAGTGNPFFTTDTAAALRALEIGADAILMAKNGVAGVYDGDPRTDPDAKFLPRVSHLEAIERGLKVMDTTALSLCMDNKLTIHVFELADGNIGRVVAGENVGTVIETA